MGVWQGKCFFTYVYIRAYIYTVLSSARAQAGVLELCCHSCRTVEMLLGGSLKGPHHPPGSQPGLSAGVTAAGEIHCLLLLEAESAHAYGRALDRGSRPRPTGAPQQGLRRQQAPRLAIAWSGVLSRKAVLQRASKPRPGGAQNHPPMR